MGPYGVEKLCQDIEVQPEDVSYGLAYTPVAHSLCYFSIFGYDKSAFLFSRKLLESCFYVGNINNIIHLFKIFISNDNVVVHNKFIISGIKSFFVYFPS